MKRFVQSSIRTTSGGFSLIEMLVSIGVISLLMSLLLPAVHSARESARQTQCRNNLHQIGVAIHSFHDQHGYVDTTFPMRAILSHMDQQPLSQAFQRASEAAVSGAFVDLSGLYSPPSYVCPSDSLANPAELQLNYAINSYAAVGGDQFQLWAKKRRFRDVSDGLSNTSGFAERLVMLAEPISDIQISEDEGRSNPLRALWQTLNEFGSSELRELAEHSLSADVRAVTQIAGFSGNQLYVNPEPTYNHIVPPNNWPFQNGISPGPYSPTSQHPGGAYVLFLDGSVKFISNSIDMEAFWALGTINGGESVTH